MNSLIRFFVDAFNGNTSLCDNRIIQEDETSKKINNVSEFIEKLIDYVFIKNENIKYKYLGDCLFKIIGIKYPIYIRILEDKFEMIIVFPANKDTKNILKKIVITFNIETTIFSLYINDKNHNYDISVGITTTVYTVFRKYFRILEQLSHNK
jgi:hypothetical protein